MDINKRSKDHSTLSSLTGSSVQAGALTSLVVRTLSSNVSTALACDLIISTYWSLPFVTATRSYVDILILCVEDGAFAMGSAVVASSGEGRFTNGRVHCSLLEVFKDCRVCRCQRCRGGESKNVLHDGCDISV